MSLDLSLRLQFRSGARSGIENTLTTIPRAIRTAWTEDAPSPEAAALRHPTDRLLLTYTAMGHWGRMILPVFAGHDVSAGGSRMLFTGIGK